FERLQRYQQTPNQNVQQYYTEVIKLCKEADSDMSDRTKLQHLFSGLKPTIKIKVIEKDPASTKEFLEYAKKVDDLQALIGKDEIITFPSEPFSSASNAFQQPRPYISDRNSDVYVAPPRRTNPHSQQQASSVSSSGSRNDNSPLPVTTTLNHQTTNRNSSSNPTTSSQSSFQQQSCNNNFNLYSQHRQQSQQPFRPCLHCGSRAHRARDCPGFG
ncbi:unnamed protein product, partial [Didymodactylos carnosus]